MFYIQIFIFKNIMTNFKIFSNSFKTQNCVLGISFVDENNSILGNVRIVVINGETLLSIIDFFQLITGHQINYGYIPSLFDDINNNPIYNDFVKILLETNYKEYIFPGNDNQMKSLVCNFIEAREIMIKLQHIVLDTCMKNIPNTFSQIMHGDISSIKILYNENNDDLETNLMNHKIDKSESILIECRDKIDIMNTKLIDLIKPSCINNDQPLEYYLSQWNILKLKSNMLELDNQMRTDSLLAKKRRIEIEHDIYDIKKSIT